MEPYVEEFKELLGMFAEEYPPSALMAFGVWLAAMILQFPLMSKNVIYTRGKKKMIAAERAGRVVIAKLENVNSSICYNDSGHRERTYFARYSYEVDGKIYYKALKNGRKNFGKMIKLYYPSGVARAKTAGELMFWDRKILPLIVPFLLAALTMWLLGYPVM